MARKATNDEIYTPSFKRHFLKSAIDALHQRRNYVAHPRLAAVGYAPSIGIRGLVISTGNRTKWREDDVQKKSEWVWELEKLGLATITPTPHLPDTQPRNYYVVSLTDYSIEEAYKIIDRI